MQTTNFAKTFLKYAKTNQQKNQRLTLKNGMKSSNNVS
jgi:hypothetical protein